jgi:amino acid adenylation domain-containing protein
VATPAAVVRPPARWTDLVSDHARRSPDAVALSESGHTVTYAELDERTDTLALHLAGMGIGPERRVALLMDRSISFVVAMVAVAKAGGAHVPVDPGYPVRRVRFVLADAQPSVLIADDALAPSLSAGFEVLRIGADGVLAGAAPGVGTGPRPVLRAEHAAYLIYTSGSTGVPKGVVVTHAGITNMVVQQIEHFRVGPDSRVLQCASIGFDAAFSEIAMALCSGARLVLAPAAALVPGPELADTVAEHAITHLTITPSALAMLEPGDLPSVATLIVAGEACPPSLAGRWSSGRRLINGYGPTETTVCVTMSDPLTGAAAPIGRPLRAVRAQVLDERLRPLPDGAPGELCVGGVGVARGYLGRPGLTAERFVADPWGAPGSRMYRTGDLVRRDDAGVFEFVGRIDDQVKIRGQRVDLGEVAVVLGEHPGVREVRVVVETDSSRSDGLVAYVLPEDAAREAPTEPPLTRSLREWARLRLPEAMVPARVVELAHFPLDAHGKLDTTALRRTVPAASVGRAPLGAVDEVLCGLFADVLSLGDADLCGSDDDFFELGGHSLLGVLLLSRLRALFGVRLTLPDLVTAPTPHRLAEVIGREAPTGGRADDQVLALRARADGAPVFCLPPASGLGWAYARLLPVIAPSHPIYALQAPGLGTADAALESMDGLAEHYANLIRSRQPHGPYHLLGWSFGGVLAHAVAVHLRRGGEPVGLLAVLDGYPGWRGTLAATGVRGEGAELSEPDALRLLLTSLGDPGEPPSDRPVEWAAARLAARESLIGATDAARVRRMLDVLRTNIRLQRDHVPSVFDGPLTLFRAKESAHDELDPAAWLPYSGGDQQVVAVPVGHHEMLAHESLAVIGPVLAELLDAEPYAGDGDRSSERSGSPGGTGDQPWQVLRNAEGQYSLWPAETEIPAGWRVEFSGGDREQCRVYVESQWTDLLPTSLAEPAAPVASRDEGMR